MVQSSGNRRIHLLYREVNKRIREVSESFAEDGPVQFLCECGREDCTATFELTQAQFDGLLSDASGMLLATDHEPSRNGARVLAKYDKFLIAAAD
jgi:hypothetical protein